MGPEYEYDITVSPTFKLSNKDIAPLRLEEAIKSSLLSEKDKWIAFHPAQKRISLKKVLRTRLIVVSSSLIHEFDIVARRFTDPEDARRLFVNAEIALSRKIKTPRNLALIKVIDGEISAHRSSILVTEKIPSLKSLTRNRINNLSLCNNFKRTELLEEFMNSFACLHREGIVHGHVFPGYIRYQNLKDKLPEPVFYNLEYANVLTDSDLKTKRTNFYKEINQISTFGYFEKGVYSDLGGILAQFSFFGFPMSDKVLLNQATKMYLHHRKIPDIWRLPSQGKFSLVDFKTDLGNSFTLAKKVLEVEYR